MLLLDKMTSTSTSTSTHNRNHLHICANTDNWLMKDAATEANVQLDQALTTNHILGTKSKYTLWDFCNSPEIRTTESTTFLKLIPGFLK